MTMQAKGEHIKELCSASPVMPVLVVKDVQSAKPLAAALTDGGISILEVTLRTPAALDVIHEMSKVPGAVVAAGTITNAEELVAAKQAGATFGITPGMTPTILAAAADQDFFLVPGVSTVSEMMMAMEYGYDFLKFFPAESAGGVGTLKSFSGPFPGIRFCPTGGITIHNAPGYLALQNVICVGGSWLAPQELVDEQAWEKITELALDARRALAP